MDLSQARSSSEIEGRKKIDQETYKQTQKKKSKLANLKSKEFIKLGKMKIGKYFVYFTEFMTKLE